MPLFHWKAKGSASSSSNPVVVEPHTKVLSTVELDSAISFARLYANTLLGSASLFQPAIDKCLANNPDKYVDHENHCNPNDAKTGPSWASPALVQTLGAGDFMYRGSGGERDQLVIDAFGDFTKHCQDLEKIGEAKPEELQYLQALNLMGNILNFVMYSDKMTEVLNSKETDPDFYCELIEPTENVYESQGNYTLRVLTEISSRQTDDPKINQILDELKAIAIKIERSLPQVPQKPSLT